MPHFDTPPSLDGAPAAPVSTGSTPSAKQPVESSTPTRAVDGDAAHIFDAAGITRRTDDASTTSRPTLGKIQRPTWQVIPIGTNVEGNEMGQRAASLQALKDQVNEGHLCDAQCQHTETVFGHGYPGAKIFFVGDAPGPREDEVGLPFVDEAGLLLGKMIRAMGIKRNDAYLTYLVKCYCPTVELESQLDAWSSVLATEINVVKPQVIITLGEMAARRITGHEIAFPHLRGKWFDYEGIPVMPTFHPQALIQHPQSKGQVWTDLKAVMRQLGLKTTPPTRAPQEPR